MDGNRLIKIFTEKFGNEPIEDLHKTYAAIATELTSGRETWLTEGPIWDAVRVSMALPGMLRPVAVNGHWLADGGLVNPVPVSVCRALGADVIIAVNLNGELIGRHITRPAQGDISGAGGDRADAGPEPDDDNSLWEKVSEAIKDRTAPWFTQWRGAATDTPGVFDVMATAINIMQDRITRSRLAGEPADVVLTPRLGRLSLLDFTHAEMAIKEGEACVERNLEEIRFALSLEDVHHG